MSEINNIDLMEEDTISSLNSNPSIPSVSNMEIDSNDSESRTLDDGSHKSAVRVSTQYVMTIVDGHFFQLVSEKCTRTNVVALCKKCEPEKREIRGHRNSSSNFLLHLEKKHGKASVKEFQEYAKLKKQKVVQNSTLQRKSRNLPQVTLTQNDFEEKIGKFIISSMVPFRVVENEYLCEILKNLNINSYGLKIPNRKSVIQVCEKLFEKNNAAIRELLTERDYVCTTADIWSGKKRSFLGVTAHWVSPGYERDSAALACRRFKSTHSFDRIAHLLHEIHLDYCLNATKLVATVTDNGSNFVKAFKIFGVDHSAIHMVQENIVLPDDDEFIDDISATGSSSDLDTQVSASQSTRESDPKKFPEAMERLLPNHIRCFSHTLNLCAVNDVQKELKKHPAMSECHSSVMTKCNALWNLCLRPKSAETVFDVLGHTLSRPGDTRWNSLFDAMNQILKIKDKCSSLYRQLNVKQHLTNNDFIYIEEYVTVSAPVAELLDILQGERNIFFGILLPSLFSLRKKLQDLRGKPWVYCQPLVEIYISSIENRFSHFFNMNSKVAETAAIAAVCHPVFKKRWFSYMDIIYHDRVEHLFKSAVMKHISTGFDSQKSCSSKGHQSEKKPAYLSFFDFGDDAFQHESQTRDEVEIQTQVEICNYLGDHNINLNMLDRYTAIRKVFLETNTPIPSSAPVERLFSFASMTNSPKASRITDKNFEMRVIMKANSFRFGNS